ncbi:MAG TPA: Hsp70 family protein [Ktedonobacteraceae bacterium]|nr:Hsp70 family protein [Ktedonobacteraceae bacterium]
MEFGVPTIGIDFGTSNSKMAWFNPKSGQADIIKNRETEEQTPSVVYYGKEQTVVGTYAVQMLEDPQEWERVIISAKREIVNSAPITLPDDRIIDAVDVATEIFRKLKRDAEERHFNEKVKHAVITCPTKFDTLEQGKIREAAVAAGFEHVELMKEPVAAARAYAEMGLKVGNYVLVYDLGGGTFDLAILARDEGNYIPVLSQGLIRCGGDDFDDALYTYCDSIAQEKLHRSISLTGRRDLHFLHDCRLRKHNLSQFERWRFSSLLSGGVPFEHELDRATFEGLIRKKVDSTVQQTSTLLELAKSSGYNVDTMVLIGGSSSVPLVQRSLKETLSLELRAWQYQNVAVAFGAAFHAHDLWNGAIKRDRYRVAVKAAWADKKMEQREVERLNDLAANLGLNGQEIASIEIEELGAVKTDLVQVQDSTILKNPPQSREATDKPRPLHEPLTDPTVIVDIPPPPPVSTFALVQTLIGHGSRVRTVAFSPIAHAIASGSDDRTIRLWDLNRGSEIALIQNAGGELQGVSSVAFSPDGWLLLSGGGDKQARLWNLKNWQLFHTFAGHKGPYGGINDVAFSHDQRLVATASNDATIKVWHSGHGALLYTFTGHVYAVSCVAFSPIGQLLVSGSMDRNIGLWNVQTGQSMGSLFGHQQTVTSISFSSDGWNLASGSEDRTIMLWDLRAKTLLRTLVGHNAPVLSVAINPDGQLLASGSLDGTVKIWNFRTGKLLQTLTGHVQAVHSVAFSRHGNSLATAGEDRTIRIWRRIKSA